MRLLVAFVCLGLFALCACDGAQVHLGPSRGGSALNEKGLFRFARMRTSAKLDLSDFVAYHQPFVGLELETKKITITERDKSDKITGYLQSEDGMRGVAFHDESATTMNIGLVSKHAWASPTDKRDEAGTAVPRDGVKGALTAEFDQSVGGGDVCQLLEFIIRPAQPIVNADSLTEMCTATRAWEKALMESGTGKVTTGMKYLADVNCGKAKSIKFTKDDSKFLYRAVPVQSIIDHYHTRLETEATKKHHKDKDWLKDWKMELVGNKDIHLIFQPMKSWTPDANQIAPLHSRVEIFMHVNFNIAVNSLKSSDGRYLKLLQVTTPKYDLETGDTLNRVKRLFGESHRNLKMCSDSVSAFLKLDDHKSVAAFESGFVLWCWKGITEMAGSVGGGGGSKDLFVVMPKVSVVSLFRSVADVDARKAFFTWSETNKAAGTVASVGGVAFAKVYTDLIAEIKKVENGLDMLPNAGSEKVLVEKWGKAVANVNSVKFAPFSLMADEIKNKELGFGRPANFFSEASSPYADYGVFLINGEPCFAAEYRQPTQNKILRNLLPSEYTPEKGVTITKFFQGLVTKADTTDAEVWRSELPVVPQGPVRANKTPPVKKPGPLPANFAVKVDSEITCGDFFTQKGCTSGGALDKRMSNPAVWKCSSPQACWDVCCVGA